MTISNKEKKLDGKAKQELLTRYYYLYLKNTLSSSLQAKKQTLEQLKERTKVIYDYDKYRKYVLSPYPDLDRVERCTAVEMLIKEKVKPSTKLTKLEHSEFVIVNLDVFQIKSIFRDNENGNAKEKECINVKDYVKRLQALPKEVQEKIRENLEISLPTLCQVSGVYFYNFEYIKIKHLVNYFNRIHKNKRSELKKYVVEKDDYLYNIEAYKQIKPELEMMDYKVREGYSLDIENDTELSIYEVPNTEPKDTRPIIFSNKFIEKSKWDLMKKNQYGLFIHSLGTIAENQKEFNDCKFTLRAFINRTSDIVPKFSDFKKNIDEIQSINFHIQKPDGNYRSVPWFYSIDYDNEENLNFDTEITYKIHPELAKYLLGLNSDYVKTVFQVAKGLKSSRNLWLFMRLKLAIDKIKGRRKKVDVLMTLKELNEQFNVKYRWAYLNREIITPALYLINEKTGLTVVCRPVKVGRSYTKVKFTVQYKSSAAPNLPNLNIPNSNIYNVEVANICNQIEQLAIVKDKNETLNKLSIVELVRNFTLPVVQSEIKEAIRKITNGTVDLSKSKASVIGWIIKQVKKQTYTKNKEAKTDNQQQLNLEENDETKEAVTTDATTPKATASIDYEITDDHIFNYLWSDVLNDLKYKTNEILIYYKNIDKNKDEKLQLLSDFLNNDFYKWKNKPAFAIINNWVQKHTIPSKENKEFGTYLHALIFIYRYYLKEYNVENILSEEEKAAIEQKAEAERKKNEPLLTQVDLKHLLKELKKEGGKEIDLTKGLTAFYEKLKTYAKENDERLIKSFIQPKLAAIFSDTGNFWVINHLSLPTLTNKFETILNNIAIEKSNTSAKNSFMF